MGNVHSPHDMTMIRHTKRDCRLALCFNRKNETDVGKSHCCCCRYVVVVVRFSSVAPGVYALHLSLYIAIIMMWFVVVAAFPYVNVMLFLLSAFYSFRSFFLSSFSPSGESLVVLSRRNRVRLSGNRCRCFRIGFLFDFPFLLDVGFWCCAISPVLRFFSAVQFFFLFN